ENKMTPDTTIEDKPFKLGDWQPQNYDRTFRGTVSIRQTAINSLNIPTIRLAEKLSIDKVLLTAQNLGISTLELNSKEANDKNLAASIGGLTNGVTVLDMAGAYSAFANHGIYTKPTAIVKVVDRKGKTIY
ncbi:MAG TPA: penicillin-binding transpeptidase domain-containing protein, partial [Megamonas funiformis]|nr:penicillin-binding transpeptidase domain-containing protein [Megamonas funiformis]